MLFDLIGKGGMAEIFLARAKTHASSAATRLCVVKQILPAFAEHPQFAEMLIHEAKLAARLDHANIVQVYDLGRDDERALHRDGVRRGLRSQRAPPPLREGEGPAPVRVRAPRRLARSSRGLDYAHRRTDDEGKPLGIVHRDVSPSNVLVSFEGRGEALRLRDRPRERARRGSERPSPRTSVREALQGKAGYMSPEHARGEPLDARADVFAAGIVLWELVAGRRMYRHDRRGPTLLEQARRADVPELPARGLPNEPELRAIVTKALSPGPRGALPVGARRCCATSRSTRATRSS